jgi:S-methylmethionine-dependent homocysteine/selenocysteine methylase
MRYGWSGVGFRQALPQTEGRTCITDGGMETVLLFRRGIDLPCFAAFPLLDTDAGRHELRAYFEPYAGLARERGIDLILDTPTWRASADWGERLGYDAGRLAETNRKGVRLIEQVRDDHSPTPVVVCGAVGPRDDAYRPGTLMSADEAERYHSAQIETLAEAGADMISGLTLTYPEEAIGIVRAARRAGIPVAVSFTVETDGRLPGGTGLGDAVARVDAETDGGPAYFMVNCAHPTHFSGVLEQGGDWIGRVGGVRANASRQSHAELDEAEELDEGDPAELADQYRKLRALLPAATVVGGCCGTDHRHVAAIADAWLDAA